MARIVASPGDAAVAVETVPATAVARCCTLALPEGLWLRQRLLVDAVAANARRLCAVGILLPGTRLAACS